MHRSEPVRAAAASLRDCARPRHRRHRRARRRDDRQFRGQGGQERRRLRPRQAVLRLGGASRTDRAGCAEVAPAAGGCADAGRAGCLRGGRGGQGQGDPAGSGGAVGRRPALAGHARRALRGRHAWGGGTDRDRSLARRRDGRRVGVGRDRGAAVVVSRPPAVRPRRAGRRPRRARCGGRAGGRRRRVRAGRRSPIPATRRRSTWPSASAPGSTPRRCSCDRRHLARAHRRLRPLRVLPADVSHLRAAVAGGDGLAARADPAHVRARRRDGRALGDHRAALRPLPRLHGLPDLVPLGRPLRPSDRADPRPRRGAPPALRRRAPPAGAGLRDRAVPAAPPARAGADAAAAAGAAGAVRGAQAAVAVGRADPGGDAGGGGAAAAGGAPARLRPARGLRRRERGHRPGAGGGGLRGGRAGEPGLLRRPAPPRRARRRRAAARQADRRDARAVSTQWSSTPPAAGRT